MKLDTRVEKALIEINFVERYEALSHTFSRSRTPKEEALDYYDVDFLMEIVNSLGYEVKFSKKENFFSLKRKKLVNMNSVLNFLWNMEW